MKTATIWYHGGPKLDYLGRIKWDRDRTTDQNALGPGFYWSNNLTTAKGYGHGRFLYRGTTKRGFRFLPRSVPTLARSLFFAASKSTQESFLEDWIDEPVDRVLAQYTKQESALDTSVLLYHDLFRYKADAYIEAIRKFYDGTIVTFPKFDRSDAEQHLVCWSLEKMKIEEI